MRKLYNWLVSKGIRFLDGALLLFSDTNFINNSKVFLKAGNSQNNFAFIWRGDNGNDDFNCSKLEIADDETSYGSFLFLSQDYNSEFGGNATLSINCEEGFYTSAPGASITAALNMVTIQANDYCDLASGANFFRVRSTGFQINGLPTTDPGIAGYLWNDAGTLKVSAG